MVGGRRLLTRRVRNAAWSEGAPGPKTWATHLLSLYPLHLSYYDTVSGPLLKREA